ncbi:Uncharacterized protein conserved in bacteria [Legionella wadsworthii]|uniref:Uncharacterized protein conserved in bacteria n=1 Tax=Legionella wadsworthii TaxID=28088 RepID=A0A378LRC3_9GAMM|nr:L,D-transpeptidase family protein [Legionella wadsworthii]STY29267.1 Uncharacterized protein conserved in bacteria [Legionella wadsworthii]
MKKYILALLISLVIILTYFELIAESSPDACSVTSPNAIPDSATQLIIVKLVKGFNAELTACKKQGQSWKKVWNSFPSVVGESGIAPVGEKKEGDMRTPAGLYPLGDAFGTKPLALKMDFKYITPEDKYIDDIAHSEYNTWVKGKTSAKNYESMFIDVYKMGIIVNYNMNPVIPGAGSAIFIHLWRSYHTGTYGCIALKEAHLAKLLHWLDKQQNPHILILK